MAYEFKLPDLGEGLTEGEVARWLVVEGQEIAEDDPLVEVQTDKTTVEIPSPAAGKVARILVAEGEVVPVGTVLVVIGRRRTRWPRRRLRPERAAARRAAPGGGATPLVRKIAQSLGSTSSVADRRERAVTEADVRPPPGDPSVGAAGAAPRRPAPDRRAHGACTPGDPPVTWSRSAT